MLMTSRGVLQCKIKKGRRLLLLVMASLLLTLVQGGPHRPATTNKGAYICITGQLSRLELANKINKLLNPLHELGYHMYIGLALSTGTSHFTNVNNGDKMRLVTSIAHATRRLRRVEGVKEVRHFLPQYKENIYANMWYKQRLDNDKSISRVKNHARQYNTLQYCNAWTNISQITDLTIRVRDDVLFERINLSDIVQTTLESGAVVTSTCDSWAGMNDKVAFLPSSLSHNFFHAPYETYLSFNAKIPALNPEKYYRYVYSDIIGLPMESVSSLYVAKAITQQLPEDTIKSKAKSLRTKHYDIEPITSTKTRASSLCQVSSNAHKSFSPGCGAAFAAENGPPSESLEKPGTYLSATAFGVTYKTKCWA